MALAGDAAATDPVCSKSPLHAALAAAADADGAAAPPPFTYRRMPAPALTP
jgi:pyrroloquinoline quinone biosynthesis protein E